MMKITKQYVKELILEELTKTDVKKLIDDAIEKKEKELRRELPKELKKELEDMLKSKDIKTDIGEIAKKVIKKLYKDLSFHHPYIIDRIKVQTNCLVCFPKPKKAISLKTQARESVHQDQLWTLIKRPI